jgi:hypothetical protein
VRSTITMARPRHRNRNTETILFQSPTSLDEDGIRVTHRTSFAKGEALVAAGKAERRMEGGLQCYQLLPPQPCPTQPLRFSPAALGAAEIMANAGLMGASRTACLSAEQRLTRVHPKSGRLLPEEDFVERTQKLVKAYPHSANFHDMKKRGISDRAVRVYPKGPPEPVGVR